MPTTWQLRQPAGDQTREVAVEVRASRGVATGFRNGQRLGEAQDTLRLLQTEPVLGQVDARRALELRTDLPAHQWAPLLHCTPPLPDPVRAWWGLDLTGWLPVLGWDEDDWSATERLEEQHSLLPNGYRWHCNGAALRLVGDEDGRPWLLPWPSDGPKPLAAIGWSVTGSRTSGHDRVEVFEVAPRLWYAVASFDEGLEPSFTRVVLPAAGESHAEAAAHLAVDILFAEHDVTELAGTDEIELQLHRSLDLAAAQRVRARVPATEQQLANPTHRDDWVRIRVTRID